MTFEEACGQLDVAQHILNVRISGLSISSEAELYSCPNSFHSNMLMQGAISKILCRYIGQPLIELFKYSVTTYLNDVMLFFMLCTLWDFFILKQNNSIDKVRNPWLECKTFEAQYIKTAQKSSHTIVGLGKILNIHIIFVIMMLLYITTIIHIFIWTLRSSKTVSACVF